MAEENRLPLLKAYPSQLAPRAIVMGDPARAAAAAELLDNTQKVAENREYYTYTGFYRNQAVTVCSHGVGAAGASVCFTELIRGGVNVLIRAGTCGALQENMEDGSLVVATGAVREDGTSDQLIPLAYPALADAGVTLALQNASAKAGIKTVSGVVLSQAHLYPGLLPGTIDLWMQAGAVAIEMEAAALFVIAGLAGARAGCLLTTDGNLARQKKAPTPESYNPHRPVVQEGVHRMLQVALEAIVKF